MPRCMRACCLRAPELLAPRRTCGTGPAERRPGRAAHRRAALPAGEGACGGAGGAAGGPEGARVQGRLQQPAQRQPAGRSAGAQQGAGGAGACACGLACTLPAPTGARLLRVGLSGRPVGPQRAGVEAAWARGGDGAPAHAPAPARARRPLRSSVLARSRLLPPAAQVGSLQQQVSALQRGREAQDRELSRLRREALELARGAAGQRPAGAEAAPPATALQEQAEAAQAAVADQAVTIQHLQRCAAAAAAASACAGWADRGPPGPHARPLPAEMPEHCLQHWL
jgi:hypothetical protein